MCDGDGPDPGLVNDVEDESLVRPLIKTNECTFAYIKVSSSVTTAAIFISSRILSDKQSCQRLFAIALVTKRHCLQHSNIYIVATSRTNSNVALLFSLLYKIRQVSCDWSAGHNTPL